VGVSLSLEGRSLRESIAHAEETIGEIRRVVVEYCREYAVGKEERQACGESVEVS
jgi:hypothetical protein